MKNSIRIGLDFHGVIDKYPEYFQAFNRLAEERGIEIYIITGGPKKVVETYLQEHKIVYKETFAILDFYDEKGEVEYFPNGEFKVPAELWNKAKGEFCARNKIDLHIDDSAEYAAWFSTPFCRYDSKSQTCLAENKIAIDFSLPPQETIKQIMSVFGK